MEIWNWKVNVLNYFKVTGEIILSFYFFSAREGESIWNVWVYFAWTLSKDRLYRIQGAITTYRSLLIVWNPDTHTPIRAILLQPLCARMTYSRDGGAKVGGVGQRLNDKCGITWIMFYAPQPLCLLFIERPVCWTVR